MAIKKHSGKANEACINNNILLLFYKEPEKNRRSALQ
jgi:hypothetical protein